MLEAWLLLPALVALLVAASTSRWRAVVRQVGLLCLAALMISLSWMTVISLVPTHERPYVDGSQHDSVFAQVFVYNGLGRIDQSSPNELLSHAIGIAIPAPPPPGPTRLLTGPIGRDIGWLLPAAVASLVAGLVATRRRQRGDRERAGYVAFGGWLVVLFAAFSVGSSLNSYYVAALAPAVAALVAGGAGLAWRSREARSSRVIVALVIVGTVAYSAWLLPTTGPAWLAPLLIGVGAASLAVLLVGPSVADRRIEVVAAALSLLVLALVPTVASATAAVDALGSFDTPFQPMAVTLGVRHFFDVTSSTKALLPTLRQAQHGAPDLMATQTSALAAPFIFASGAEVLPIGGFTGTIPSPTLAQLVRWIHEGRFHLVLESSHATGQRFEWIAEHCLSVPRPANGARSLAIYYCLPSS
jgi:4-amino-4-deoxy-L-arabinose transferase-like glycosyltransferase